MTFNATLAILINGNRLVPYAPRLRSDQMPQRLVYLRWECRDQVEALEDDPGGENPDPIPREQIKGLLDDFCAGEDFERPDDYEPRGKKLFVLRTRSVRAGVVFLSPEVMVVLDIKPRASFNRKKGGALNFPKWYQTCRVLAEGLRLMTFAMENDPWAENAKH